MNIFMYLFIFSYFVDLKINIEITYSLRVLETKSQSITHCIMHFCRKRQCLIIGLRLSSLRDLQVFFTLYLAPRRYFHASYEKGESIVYIT